MTRATRTVRERNLESRTARAKLAPSEKPYWRFVDSGLHIGYRKNLHGGKWVVRRYLGNQTYATETLASSDDRQDADGKTILSFSQAQKKVLEVAKQYREAGPNASRMTVADAVEAYLSGSRARDQHTRLDKHILQSDIAKRQVASLTETALASWRKSLASNLGAATRKRITTDFKAVLNSFTKMRRRDLPADMPTIIKNGLASNERVESGVRIEQILSDPISGGWLRRLGKLIGQDVGKVTLRGSLLCWPQPARASLGSSG
jgi:hypothetical protein